MFKNMVSSSFKAIGPKFRFSFRSYTMKSSKRKSETNKTIASKNSLGKDIEQPEKVNTQFVAQITGLPYAKWYSIFKKHPELSSLSRQNFLNSIYVLKAMRFSNEDILEKPMILYMGSSSIQNRYDVLKECGIEPISITILFKYITIMNKSVTMLKTHQYIPYKIDVVQRLYTHFTDIKLESKYLNKLECNENKELKKLRQIILNSYLKNRLNLTDANIEKLWKSYGRVRHRSFQSIQSIIKLLIDDLNFSEDRIMKNGFLLYADSDNVRRIITKIPTIGGQDIKDIGYRRPKILMSNCDALLKTINHVKSFGISEEAITRCLEVLTLGPDTVLERLQELNEVEEFQVLCTNPRVLRLVHYQNKARMRLEYLNQLKVRCASLHILSCGSEAFARFARDGSDRTKGRDVVVYLANVMKRDENDVRGFMSRHPNWCHIPVIHVKQCYEFLLKNKFSVDDIYHNMHLLLYPIKRIEEKLMELKRKDYPGSIDIPTKLSNNEILTLVLYYIECEFHFTGDGIWTDHHTQQVENFSNLLPDFPEAVNKVYKYGVKPAANRNLQQAHTMKI